MSWDEIAMLATRGQRFAMTVKAFEQLVWTCHAQGAIFRAPVLVCARRQIVVINPTKEESEAEHDPD